MKNTLIQVFALCLILVACSPSESVIQKAIAKTQTAASTNVPSTETPTITPSPTPDLRVIKVDPKEFLLSKDDLPIEAKYYLPNQYWISPHRNVEILQDMGAEDGGKYINATGRIDGWWADYMRGSSKVVAPKEVYNNVIMYQTAAGAQLFITKYGDLNLADGYAEVENASRIGEVSRTYILKKGNTTYYLLDFAYRNYVHRIQAYGLESEVKPEFVMKIAKILLSKLETAPLSAP